MDEVFFEELHQYNLAALKALAAFCEDHNLTYFAIGGTLLGAVRHKGFIPWDDDVDVAMPRLWQRNFRLLLCWRNIGIIRNSKVILQNFVVKR